MDKSANLDVLFVEVAELAGLEEVVKVQEDRSAWILGMSETDTVLAEWQEGVRRMLFMLEIAPLPQDSFAHWMSEALQFNLLTMETGGVRFALLPPENRLQLLMDLPEELMSPSQVAIVLENMQRIADEWRGLISTDSEYATSAEDNNGTRAITGEIDIPESPDVSPNSIRV